jgi:hypothetical protein
MVLKKRYEAEIEDAKYKIKCYSDQELIIPEHPDITGEVDKLLSKISAAEDKFLPIYLIRELEWSGLTVSVTLAGLQTKSLIR